MKRCFFALITVSFVLNPLSGNAASASWRCQFPSYGEPITFIAELGTGKGKMVGNLGVSDVWVLEGSDAISFIEPLQTGVVQVTSIVIKSGEAAHSRNTLITLDGTFMPSQVVGKCRILP